MAPFEKGGNLKVKLDRRKQLILTAIIERFIESGEPVGSQAVVDYLDIGVSTATIRNEMSALSELGLIEQPHTSAGRVPSHLGYRFYIQNLMHKKPLTSSERHHIDSIFSVNHSDIEQLLESASNTLAYLTNCASISTTPQHNFLAFAHIELIPISKRVVILLFITTTGIAKNKLFRLNYDPSTKEYAKFVLIVNEHLKNTPVDEITPAFIQTLAAAIDVDIITFSPILYAVYTMASEISDGHIILEGGNNLLSHRELAENAKNVMDFIGKHDNLKKMIEQNPDNLSIIIGTEKSEIAPAQIGIIFSKYYMHGLPAGSVGIIGPRRINYAKIIPYVEYIAISMGKLLSSSFLPSPEEENKDGEQQ